MEAKFSIQKDFSLGISWNEDDDDEMKIKKSVKKKYKSNFGF